MSEQYYPIITNQEQYYSIITNQGKALEADSSANGTVIHLQDFVVGDGNGNYVVPDPAQTALVNPVYQAAISKMAVSPDQPNQFIAWLVIPATVGGFVVREVGVLTDKGELYAIGNCAAIEKPLSGVSVTLQFRLAVSDTADIDLIVSTGDGMFLRIDANLSDVEDVEASRDNLGLGSAAVKDTGTSGVKIPLLSTSNTWSEVQTFKKDISVGTMQVHGKATFNEEVYLENKRVMIDEPNPGAVENGQYVTSEAYCWRLLGRGGTGDPEGAVAKLFYRELVGTTNEVILHIVGFGIDTSFSFDGGSGDFKVPGNVRAGNVYAGNAYMAGDGNIWGTRWNANGQWLWDAITDQINAVVRDVRMGSPGTIVLKRGDWNYVPGGCAFTGWYIEGDAPVDDTIQYKPIQILINGSWRTIAG